MKLLTKIAAEVLDTLNFPFVEWTIENELTGDQEHYQCITGFHLLLFALVLALLIF